jgi:hypothetical protein
MFMTFLCWDVTWLFQKVLLDANRLRLFWWDANYLLIIISDARSMHLIQHQLRTYPEPFSTDTQLIIVIAILILFMLI